MDIHQPLQKRENPLHNFKIHTIKYLGCKIINKNNMETDVFRGISNVSLHLRKILNPKFYLQKPNYAVINHCQISLVVWL